MACNINFYLERRKDKTTDLPVLIQITFDNKRYKTTTGIKADKVRHWNQSKQSFIPSAPNAALRNQALKLKREQMDAIYWKAMNTVGYVTPEQIADRFHNRLKEGFFDLFQSYINERQEHSGWSANTRRHFEIIKDIIFKMSKTEGVTTEFKTINAQWRKDLFSKFLSRGLTTNTAKHYIACLDMFFRWVSKAKGIEIEGIASLQVEDKAADIRKNSKSIVALEPAEFITLVNAKFTGTLALVRDIFVIQCSTGLRISDVLNLRSDNIKEDGVSLITQKTTTPVEIPFNDFNRHIFSKYSGLASGRALPEISRNTVNNCLREIGKILEFDREIVKATTKKGQLDAKKKPLHECLTSHAGRRTFVSLGVALKMDQKTMMEFTTHKDKTVFNSYQRVSDGQKRRTMQTFNEENLKQIS